MMRPLSSTLPPVILQAASRSTHGHAAPPLCEMLAAPRFDTKRFDATLEQAYGNATQQDIKAALDQAIQKNDREFVQKLLALGAHPHQAAANFRTLDPAMHHLLVFHERRRTLYAQDTFRDQPTPLDKQLQALQDPGSEEGRKILKLLRKEGKPEAGNSAGFLARILMRKPDFPVVAVWNNAAGQMRLDILRALLLLLPEDAIRKKLARAQPDGQLFNSPLQQALPAIKEKDRGLADVIKEFPYQSDRHIRRGSWKDFNHRLQFISSTSDRNRPKAEKNDHRIGRNIACRNYATYQLDRMGDDPALKFDYRRFGRQDLIMAKVGTDTEARVKKIRAETPEVHLIDNAKFGEFLAEQFKTMEGEGKATKAMLLSSSNHAMTLGLRIKKKEGTCFYVVKFFDPNVTTHGTRSKASLKTFESQSLTFYLMMDGDLVSYYPESQQDKSYPEGISIAYVRPTNGEPKPEGSSSAGIEGRTLTSVPEGPLSPAAIWYAMRSGFDGSLRQWKGQIANLPVAQRLKLLDAKLKVFDAKGRDDALGALYVALQNGFGAAIRAYAELLKMIPESQRAALAAAKRGDGISGLYMALQGGHADAIRAYTEILKIVPESRRTALLAAKSSDGTPGFYIALHDGHVDALRAYAELLKMVPENQRGTLLETEDANVIPDMYEALQKCPADVVQEYVELFAMVAENRRPPWLKQLFSTGTR